MLVLKRDHGESVTVTALDLNGQPLMSLVITVARGGPVRLGFIAEPGDFKITRTELLKADEKDRGAAP